MTTTTDQVSKLELSAFSPDKMEAEERAAVFMMADEFIEHLRNECGYTHHRTSTTNNLAMVLDAENGFNRPVDAMLPSSWDWFYREKYSSKYGTSYRWYIASRMNEILARLDVTVRERFKPLRGEFIGKFTERLTPVPNRPWQYDVNTWQPYIITNPHADPFASEPEFDPFGPLNFDEWQAEQSKYRHHNAHDWLTEYFERLFPDEWERQVCVDWIAFGIQCPDIKIPWGCIWPSLQGTGKGFAYNHLLHPMTAGQSAQASKFANITGEHMVMNADCIFIMVDDAVPSDKQNSMMKSLLTEPRTYVNRKQQQPEFVPSYARYVAAYNPEDTKGLDLPEDDRRWFVCTLIKHKVNRDESAEFLGEFENWILSNESLHRDAIWRWFYWRDLSEFDYRKCPPATAQKKTLIAESAPDLAESLSLFLLTRTTNYFTLDDFREYYRYNLKTSDFNDAVKHVGYDKVTIQKVICDEFNITTGRPTFYVNLSECESKAQASRDFLRATLPDTETPDI